MERSTASCNLHWGKRGVFFRHRLAVGFIGGSLFSDRRDLCTESRIQIFGLISLDYYILDSWTLDKDFNWLHEACGASQVSEEF